MEGRGGAVNAGKGRGGGAVNAGAAQVSRMQVGTEATGALASISSSTRLNDMYYKISSEPRTSSIFGTEGV